MANRFHLVEFSKPPYLFICQLRWQIFYYEWCLKQRFLLTVIYCQIYHWLEVSHEVDISQARSASDIFIEDWPITCDILGNKSLVSRTLFRFLPREMTKRHVYPSDVSSFCHYMKRNPAKNFDCNSGLYMYFVSFWCEKTMLHRLTSWKWELTSPNKSKWHQPSPCSDCHAMNHQILPLSIQAASVRFNNLSEVCFPWRSIHSPQKIYVTIGIPLIHPIHPY